MEFVPFVSVVVPVLNAESTLRGCVEALLAQGYPAHLREIIFVDNGCTDGSVGLLGEYPVRVVAARPARNIAAARNQGIRCCRGEIVVFTDSDCIPSSDWLAELVKPFADPGVGACAGRVLAAPPSTLVERYCGEAGMLSQEYAVQHPYLPSAQTCNVGYRMDAFGRMGLLDEGLTRGSDTDIAWRLQLETGLRLAYVPSAVVLHRHRTTARKLFRQFYGYGIGDEQLSWRYPAAGYAPLRSEVRFALQNSAAAIPGLPKRTAGLLRGRMSPLEFWTPYLSLVPQVAKALGRAREQSRRWFHLPGVRTQQGERRVPRLEKS